MNERVPSLFRPVLIPLACFIGGLLLSAFIHNSVYSSFTHRRGGETTSNVQVVPRMSSRSSHFSEWRSSRAGGRGPASRLRELEVLLKWLAEDPVDCINGLYTSGALNSLTSESAAEAFLRFCSNDPLVAMRLARD